MRLSTEIQLFIVFTVLGGCGQNAPYNQEIISYEDEPILVGKVDLEGFSKEPYSSWFNENYSNYQVDEASLDGIDLGDIEIRVFLGTWCSDSQLQVPQFYKILTYLDYDKSKLEMIGMENHANKDLTTPQNLEEGLNINFVPTIIFYRKGVEIGRIVEFPKESLEADMARIVNSSN